MACVPNKQQRRGFTLVELMVVVVLITVMSALSIPTIRRQLRDQRTREAAAQTAALYRNAKLQAMARGVAVNVRFNATGRGSYVVMVALRRAATAATPPVGAETCTVPNWNGVANTDYRVDADLYGTSKEDVFLRMVDESATAVGTLDVCVTPMGRTFFRTNFGNPFVPLTAIHRARIFRSANGTTVEGLERGVLIMPSGMARTVL